MSNTPVPDCELEILDAADRWASEVMRQDKYLDPFEQKLFEAVLKYRNITRTSWQLPKPAKILNNPVPQIRFTPIGIEIESEQLETLRYSETPTRPSPAGGMKAIAMASIYVDEE